MSSSAVIDAHEDYSDTGDVLAFDPLIEFTPLEETDAGDEQVSYRPSAGPEDTPAPPTPLDHHNHRFRIDFSEEESLVNTTRIRRQRQAWLANEHDLEDTLGETGAAWSEEFLLAALAEPRRLPWRRRWKKRLAQVVRCTALILLFYAAGMLVLDRIPVTGGNTSPAFGIFYDSSAAPSEALHLLSKPPPAPKLQPVRSRDVNSIDETPASDSPQVTAPGPPWRLMAVTEKPSPRRQATGPVGRVLDWWPDAFSKPTSDRNPRYTAEFFGAKAQGRRFAFVVDCARDANGDGRDDQCWERVKRELAQAILQLNENAEFLVLLFDAQTHVMFNRDPALVAAVRANRENASRLVHWLENTPRQEQSRPLSALKLALAGRPEIIFLLSYHAVNAEAAPYLRENNNFHRNGRLQMPGAVVHTIGFHSDHKPEELGRIAAENGGRFHCADCQSLFGLE